MDEFQKFARIKISQSLYKGNATNSSAWSKYGLQVFRASHVLFDFSEKAREKYWNLFGKMLLGDIKKDHAGWVSSQKDPEKNQPEPDYEMNSLSPEMQLIERQLSEDGELLHFSYTLLARAIELLLKALLIERDKNYLLRMNNKGNYMLDNKKLKHSLVSLFIECKISVTEEEAKQIFLLEPLSFSGTYPIPKSEDVFIQNQIRPIELNYSLDRKNYQKISQLFDKILTILNSERIKNGQLPQTNLS